MKSALSDYTINSSVTIKESIRVITGNFTRCGVIINSQQKVLGVLSEGDIVRSVTDEISLFAPVEKITNPSFCFAKDRDIAKAFSLLCSKGVTLLPIVDDDFKLLDVITIHDILDSVELKRK